MDLSDRERHHEGQPDGIPLLGQYSHAANDDRRFRRGVYGRGTRRLRRCRGYQRGTDAIHAGLRRASSGADRWADCRTWCQGRRCRRDRPNRADTVRVRQKRDPARLRGASPRVPGADGPLFAGARRVRLVWRPFSAATQPQPRNHLDDAARRLQAVLCRRLRRRFRPKGRRSGKPGLPAGPG